MRIARTSSPYLDSILGLQHKVLDHGFVRVIDYMGDDSAIVQAARVSYGAGTKAVSDDRGLIRYLMRKAHTSPLEMAEIKLHCKLPIFVARQWIRHRTANVNELSARYSILDSEFYIPELGRISEQSGTNKQGSGDVIAKVNADIVRQELIKHSDKAAELYELLREKLRAVSEGRAKLDDVLRSWKVLVGAELKPWCAENQTKLMPKLAASEDDRKLVESSGLAQHLAA